MVKFRKFQRPADFEPKMSHVKRELDNIQDRLHLLDITSREMETIQERHDHCMVHSLNVSQRFSTKTNYGKYLLFFWIFRSSFLSKEHISFEGFLFCFGKDWLQNVVICSVCGPSESALHSAHKDSIRVNTTVIWVSNKRANCYHQFIDYSFQLAARDLICAPFHRQDSTYHGICTLFVQHHTMIRSRAISHSPLA